MQTLAVLTLFLAAIAGAAFSSASRRGATLFRSAAAAGTATVSATTAGLAGLALLYNGYVEDVGMRPTDTTVISILLLATAIASAIAAWSNIVGTGHRNLATTVALAGVIGSTAAIAPFVG
jgi:hypothetical protein